MLRSLAAAGGTLLFLALTPATARADAVGPPPANCPDGTTGTSCHGGSYCEPTTCKTYADCSAGQTCQPRSYCQIPITCGGGVVFPDGGSAFPTVMAAGEPCATDGACDAGACASQNVCIAPTPAGCSCEAAGAGGGPLALSALAAIAGVAGAWRRRGKRPGRS